MQVKTVRQALQTLTRADFLFLIPRFWPLLLRAKRRADPYERQTALAISLVVFIGVSGVICVLIA
ncbi:MAG: hypothetical protein JXB85_07745 [Anaerolineales bacterium]|nr:hypothetical protein [Anaerolineales bacterium]